MAIFAAAPSSKPAEFRFRCLNEGVICALMMDYALLYNCIVVCTSASGVLYNDCSVCTFPTGFCTIGFLIVRSFRISHTMSHLAQTSHDQPKHDFDIYEMPSTGKPPATGVTWYLTLSPDAPRRAFRHSRKRGSVQRSMYHPTPSTVCACESPTQQGVRYVRHPMRRICPTASPSACTCLNAPT